MKISTWLMDMIEPSGRVDYALCLTFVVGAFGTDSQDNLYRRPPMAN